MVVKDVDQGTDVNLDIYALIFASLRLQLPLFGSCLAFGRVLIRISLLSRVFVHLNSH